MRYRVHAFALIRVKSGPVEADDMPSAIRQFTESVDWYDLCSRMKPRLKETSREGIDDADFAEEFSHYLVDVEGDEGHEESQWFGPDLMAPPKPRTPLPWALFQLGESSDPEERFIIVTRDGGHEVTGIVHEPEDARFIVRVCNSGRA